MLGDDDLRSSLTIARTNWTYWRDVYEDTGPVSANPLFAEPGRRFAAFCKEYSVHRTIRAGTQNDFRLILIKLLPAALCDDSGKSLDQVELRVRPNFGTHNGTRRMISVISKAAAFLRPERFVAWDRFARKGLNIISGRNPNASFEDYADYLHAFDETWNDELGERIRRYITRSNAHSPIEMESRFQRRVLDVALMKCGDRKMSETW
jgi:hypothetical protein